MQKESMLFFLFPCWEQFIPTLGTIYSHVGNNLFPCWEQFIPTLGTFYSHVGNNPNLIRNPSLAGLGFYCLFGISLLN